MYHYEHSTKNWIYERGAEDDISGGGYLAGPENYKSLWWISGGYPPNEQVVTRLINSTSLNLLIGRILEFDVALGLFDAAWPRLWHENGAFDHIFGCSGHFDVASEKWAPVALKSKNILQVCVAVSRYGRPWRAGR